MSNFLENILNSDLCAQLFQRLKERFGATKLGGTLQELGIDEDDLGQMAKGVINVIGIAGESVDEETEAEEAEEEVEETGDDVDADCEEDDDEASDCAEEEEYLEEEDVETADEETQPSKKMRVARTAIDILKKILKK